MTRIKQYNREFIMTQEELDALMSGDEDMDSIDESESVSSQSEETEEGEEENYEPTADEYVVKATHNWPPPPPTDDNKVVHQLDDVTKESEEKASEIFDIIEKIGDELLESESTLADVSSVLNGNAELFATLMEKFPNVNAFPDQLEKNKTAIATVEEHIASLQSHGDEIMNIMDIMQYQDIHRQKIERVINVMRALSNYMNLLFAGKKDDDKRVSSAHHLPGDSTTNDVVDADDIEALLASFGAK